MSLDNIKKRTRVSEQSPANEKYFVEEMLNKEISHINMASEIEEKINTINRSTVVLIPQFSYLHNYLRMKYIWYYKWHFNRRFILIHCLILFCYAIALVIFFIVNLK
ncbi:MAG: hypothetical protein BWY19_00192 [bacterium ADurb.Bin212]|nr:MAG: hypothetical protein BWY19_00192 [bacterium ADurb.Bin212]